MRLKADGKLVNIEMQTTNRDDLPKRIRYYQALGDSQLLLRNASFSALPEFLTIFVCTFDPFKLGGGKSEDGLPLYTIRHFVEERPALIYDDGRRIMMFNAAAWKKSLAQSQKDMLKYIINGGSDFASEKVSAFAGMVRNVKTENIFRRNYMTLSLKIQEIKMDARDDARKEAQEELAQRDLQIAADQARIAELEARLAKYEDV